MGRYRTIYTENQNGDGYEAEKKQNGKNTAAYSTMQTTGWTVVLNAPELELTGAAKKFTSMVVVTSVLFLVVAITIVGVAIRKMV